MFYSNRLLVLSLLLLLSLYALLPSVSRWNLLNAADHLRHSIGFGDEKGPGNASINSLLQFDIEAELSSSLLAASNGSSWAMSLRLSQGADVNLLPPRLVRLDRNEIFSLVENCSSRELHFVHLFTREEIVVPSPWTERNQRHWTTLVKNKQLFLIDFLKPLNVFQCSLRERRCRRVLDDDDEETFVPSSVFLHPGSEFVRFGRSDYFVSLAWSEVSWKRCLGFSRLHLLLLSTRERRFRLLYASDVLMFDRLPFFDLFSIRGENRSCEGLVRTLRPESIVSWTSSDDRLTFILTVEQTKAYFMQIKGIGKLLHSIIDEQTTKPVDAPARIRLVSASEENAWKYCQRLVERHEQSEKFIRTAEQNVIESATFPKFRVVASTLGKNLHSWIDADRVHFGLLGRFFREYELVYPQRRAGINLMIDAGGNHGTYAFYAATFNQSVQIFEVLPKYAFIIAESMRINSQWNGRITLHRFGVSDQPGRWKILPDEGTTRLDFLPANVDRNELDDDLLVTSRTAPLDQFIFQRISLLKIDVEGFEIRALKGAYRALQVFGVGAILIEIAPARWNWNNITVDEGIHVLEYVSKIGQFSNYLIARSDATCPREKFSRFDGFVKTKSLSMLNMSTGQSEFAPDVYQFFNWTSLIREMTLNRWDCNFWLESDLARGRNVGAKKVSLRETREGESWI